MKVIVVYDDKNGCYPLAFLCRIRLFDKVQFFERQQCFFFIWDQIIGKTMKYAYGFFTVQFSRFIIFFRKIWNIGLSCLSIIKRVRQRQVILWNVYIWQSIFASIFSFNLKYFKTSRSSFVSSDISIIVWIFWYSGSLFKNKKWIHVLSSSSGRYEILVCHAFPLSRECPSISKNSFILFAASHGFCPERIALQKNRYDFASGNGSMDESEFEELLDKYFFFFRSRYSRKCSKEEYERVAKALFCPQFFFRKCAFRVNKF